jgi:hypothetical protein
LTQSHTTTSNLASSASLETAVAATTARFCCHHQVQVTFRNHNMTPVLLCKLLKTFFTQHHTTTSNLISSASLETAVAATTARFCCHHQVQVTFRNHNMTPVVLWKLLKTFFHTKIILVLSEPSSGMTDLLGHAGGQTWFILAILAHVGAWQAARGGGTLGAFWAQFRHDCWALSCGISLWILYMLSNLLLSSHVPTTCQQLNSQIVVDCMAHLQNWLINPQETHYWQLQRYLLYIYL